MKSFIRMVRRILEVPGARETQEAIEAARQHADSLHQLIRRTDNTLDFFGDGDLIHEMLKRGYVVMRCPEPGVWPESLTK